MKKIIFILLLSSIYAKAQKVPDNAHLRGYNFNMNTNFDTRIGRICLKPEINLNLLNQGKLQINAFYGKEIARVESWDSKTFDPGNTLISTGLDRKLSCYEVSGGYNFINNYNPDAIIRTSWTSVNSFGNTRTTTTTTLFEDGTRKKIGGVRAGFGAYRSLLGSEYKNFELGDENKVPLTGSNKETYRRMDVKGHTITEYQFIGFKIASCGTPNRRAEKIWGGRVVTYFVDYINVSKLYAAPLYTPFNDKLYVIPKENRKFTGSGFRLGFQQKGSGRAGVNIKIEGGVMPNLSDYAPNIFFVNFELGLHITPLLAVIADKEDY